LQFLLKIIQLLDKRFSFLCRLVLKLFKRNLELLAQVSPCTFFHFEISSSNIDKLSERKSLILQVVVIILLRITL